jgi:aspartate/tyrosine/aromatic aminotransferase
MFVFSGLSRAQCEHLTRQWHVYLTADGRISLAGLSEGRAGYLARAIADAVARA